MSTRRASDNMHVLRQSSRIYTCPNCGRSIASSGYASHVRACKRRQARRRPRG